MVSATLFKREVPSRNRIRQHYDRSTIGGQTPALCALACSRGHDPIEFSPGAAPRVGEVKAMLFLTRKVGESIVINDDIEVTVVEVRGRSIKLGFTFPPEAKVLRRELHDRIKAEAQGGGAPINGAAPEAKSDS
jgi:carbon storage regulator